MPNGNYTYVIDSSFKPFTMQEMLVPLTAYKDAFEKTEVAYDELSQKAGDFEYLSQTLPEGSEARRIYEGYANDLKVQANDLARNGLTMNNRRALGDLKRRYQGEIGRLEKANTRLMEQQKIRNEHLAKGLPMLYAEDNLNIDQFLDNDTPNLYGINSDDLYSRGAMEGKTISSRMYNAEDGGPTLGGYYRMWVERNGISPESIGAFMNSDLVQQRVGAILSERGADNLSEANYARAWQSVMNGIYNGIVYQESVKPVRDESRMSASAAANYALQREMMEKNAAMRGMFWDRESRSWKYDQTKDPSYLEKEAITKLKLENSGSTGSGGSRGASYDVRNKEVVMIGANTGTGYKYTDKVGKARTPAEFGARSLTTQEYASLIDNGISNEYVRNITANGQLSDYEIWVVPDGSTKLETNGIKVKPREDVYILVPRETKRSASDNPYYGGGIGAGYTPSYIGGYNNGEDEEPEVP